MGGEGFEMRARAGLQAWVLYFKKWPPTLLVSAMSNSLGTLAQRGKGGGAAVSRGGVWRAHMQARPYRGTHCL